MRTVVHMQNEHAGLHGSTRGPLQNQNGDRHVGSRLVDHPHAMCTWSVACSRRAPERLRRGGGLLPWVLGTWVLGILSECGVSERDRVFGRRLPLSALLLPLRKLSLLQLLRERELLGRRPQRPRRA